MFEISSLILGNHHTSLALILFASMLTVLLSLILVLTYEKTSRQVTRPDHFIQSLLLMSVVTCTIMQSIGDSLALSFGIFGALAIIRFRTRISDPRDVAFVFATMAIGIACGVHSFINGIVGTLIFCIIIVVLYFSPFGQKNNLIGYLRLSIPCYVSDKQINQILLNFTKDFNIKRIRYNIIEDEIEKTEYEFKFLIRDNTDPNLLSDELKKIEGLKVLRFNFENENDIEAT